MTTSASRLQVACLVQELTTEVLQQQPSGSNVYNCCALYLERKLKLREASPNDMMDSVALERQVVKARQDLQSLSSGMTTGTGVLPAHNTTPVDVGRGLNALGALPKVTEITGPEEGQNCCLASLKGHKAAICQICVTPEYIISASREGSIMVWDIKTGKKLRVLKCNKVINTFCFVERRAGENYLICGCDDGRFLVLCLYTHNESKLSLHYGAEFSAHLPNPIRAMSASPDLHWIATGDCFTMSQITMFGTRQEGIRGTVKIWDLENILVTATYENDEGLDKGPVMLKTMKQLVSNSTYRQASYSRFVDWHDREKTYGIRALAYTPDGSRLAVGFGHPDDVTELDSRMLVICCAHTLATLWVYPGNTHQITSLDFLRFPMGEDHASWDMVVSHQYGICKMALILKESKFQDGDQSKTNHGKGIACACHWSKSFKQDASFASFSPDGHYIAVALGSTITLWDSTSGQMSTRLGGHTGQVTHVYFTPDSKMLVSAGEDKTIRVWAVPKRLLRSVSQSAIKFMWRSDTPPESFSSVNQ